MSKEKQSTKLIKEYLAKYPEMKDYTLAKKVYNAYPQLFKDIEQVRYRVLYWRGHAGQKNRSVLSDDNFVKPLNYDTRNEILELKSQAPGLKTFKLPKEANNILFLSDIHFPYQDNDALITALEYGLENKCNTIWLNGDVMDMFQASSHEKLPNKATINEEFEMCRAFLKKLRKLFPKAYIYFLEGNHEKRWQRYLMRKAPEILGCDEFEIPTILRVAEYNVKWIPNSTLVKFGKLNVVHGNCFGGGINPARTAYLKAKACIIVGDKHKTGENTEMTMNGEMITAWSVGALCDLNPEYLQFAHTSWCHGFAHIKMDGDTFHVRNYRILNGKIL